MFAVVPFVLGFIRAFTFRPVRGFTFVPSPPGRMIMPPADTYTFTLEVTEPLSLSVSDELVALREFVHTDDKPWARFHTDSTRGRLFPPLPAPTIEYEPAAFTGRRYVWTILADERAAQELLARMTLTFARWSATCRLFANLGYRRSDQLQRQTHWRKLPRTRRMQIRWWHALQCARGTGPADGYFDPPMEH